MKAIKTLFMVCLFLSSGTQILAQDKEPQKKLHHVLLFQWKDGADTNTKAEVISLLKNLPEKIDGFDKIDVADLTMSSDKFNIVIVETFDSEAAFKMYEKHPDHLRIGELAPSLLSGFSQFDYWK